MVSPTLRLALATLACAREEPENPPKHRFLFLSHVTLFVDAAHTSSRFTHSFARSHVDVLDLHLSQSSSSSPSSSSYISSLDTGYDCAPAFVGLGR